MEDALAWKRVAQAERELRLVMRTTVETFQAYAIALLAAGAAKSSVGSQQLTAAEQDADCEQAALPIDLFYAWLRDDMLSVCVTEGAATLQ